MRRTTEHGKLGKRRPGIEIVKTQEKKKRTTQTESAFLLYGKTGKNFRVKGTGKFSSVKMERDERVPFTPIYAKKTLNPPNSNIN